MSTPLDELAADLLARAQDRTCFVFAVVGPPGAGKSTLAEALVTRLEQLSPGTPGLFPMDGYHFDNAVLAERGLLALKGAPETFDVQGIDRALQALRQGAEVYVPVFDRRLDLARAGARVIGPAQRIVVVEGNYLLLTREPWTGLNSRLDRSLMIAPPEAVLRNRLVARWLAHGLAAEDAHRRAEENDVVNARLVMRASRPADVYWADSDG